MLEGLSSIAYEARNEDWDGYGGKPVTQSTLEVAQYLILSLPESLDPPELAPEPDGEIELEWFIDPETVFAISIGENSLLSWAYRIDGERGFGSTLFYTTARSLPQSVLVYLSRLRRVI
jgi:hypothetical protein